MKKFFFLIVCLCATTIYGQSLILKHNNNIINSGDTIYATIDPSSMEDIFIDLENTTDDTLYIMVAKNTILSPSNAILSYCLGECYATDTSLTAYSLAPNVALTFEENAFLAFHISYIPNGEHGPTFAEFTLFSNTNDDVYGRFFISINNTPTSITDYTNNTISIYPNPSTNYMNVTLNNNIINAKYSIYNILGKKIAESSISSSSFTINTKEIEPGVYFLKISDEKNNLINTRKFIVK